MRSIVYFFLLGAFAAVYACSSEAETPEQFVDRLIPILQEKNEDLLFETFVSKQELRDLLELVVPPDLPAHQLDTRVEELWEAALEDKGNMMRRFLRAGVSDWNLATVDSISKRQAPQTAYDGTPLKSEELELADITIHFTYQGEKKTMTINCLQIHQGPWKMANYPEMQEAD